MRSKRSIKKLLLAAVVTAAVAMIWHQTPISRWNYSELRRGNEWINFHVYFYVYMCLSLAILAEFIVKQRVIRIFVPSVVLGAILYSFAMMTLNFEDGTLIKDFSFLNIYRDFVVYAFVSLEKMTFLVCMAAVLVLHLTCKRFPSVLE